METLRNVLIDQPKNINKALKKINAVELIYHINKETVNKKKTSQIIRII